MRLFAAVAAVLLTSCAPAPPPPEPAKPDATKEPWYAQTTNQLVELNSKAQTLLRKGKLDTASALVTEGLPLMNRLISVPRPTLEATEAASDLDHLYARILLEKKQYGWARLQFQKNVARWQNWTPQTEDTVRRLKQAQAGIAETDRRLAR